MLTSYLPDPPYILVLIQRLEQELDPLADATVFFYLICNASDDPKAFNERVYFWIDKHLCDLPKGGGFTDAEIRNVIFSGSQKAAETILDRIDILCDKKRVLYIPDEYGDPASLYVSLLIESSRLFRLLKVEGYSEKTREVLDFAQTAFTRLNKKEIHSEKTKLPAEYSIFVYAIGTFVYFTRFFMQKTDGEYELAFKSLGQGMGLYILSTANSYFNKVKSEYKSKQYLHELNSFADLVVNRTRELPWISQLEPQKAVDCFEAIKKGDRFHDVKNIAAGCRLLAHVYSEWWELDENTNKVDDSEGSDWQVIDYWYHASGWLEGKLKPSDLRDVLNDHIDSDSEKRLCAYFFGSETWNKLPQRMKRSLISADRDWLGSTISRREAILNELKIATEEILCEGLWKPLEHRIRNNDIKSSDNKWFIGRKLELINKNSVPTLLDFEQICKKQFTKIFLKEKGITDETAYWFCNRLPLSLYKLRNARNRADHEIGTQIDIQELRNIYNEFMGLGQSGILPELSRILLPMH